MADFTWYVHRDGGLWTVRAPTLLLAFNRAQRQRKFGTWMQRDPETYIPDGVTWLPNVSTPSMSRTGTVLVPSEKFDDLIALHTSGQHERTIEVESMPSIEWRAAIEIVRKLDNALTNYWAKIALRPIAVARFKSGAWEGAFRFTKKHSAEYRQQVHADDEWNDELRQVQAGARENLSVTLDVLVGVHTTPVGITELGEFNSAHEQLTYACNVSTRLQRNDVRLWAVEGLATIARQLVELESQRDHGFAVGSFCYVPPLEESLNERSPVGRCQVLRAHVESSRHVGGKAWHSRTIVDANGDEWGEILVSQLKV